MEQARQNRLEEQLGELDGALVFLALMILALYLSWRAAALQRTDLCRYLAGEEGPVHDVYPLRLSANAVVAGALTYFFGLALKTWEDTRGTGGCARRSADLNLWAALLVLAAALIRLYDLVCVQERGEGAAQGMERRAQDSLWR